MPGADGNAGLGAWHKSADSVWRILCWSHTCATLAPIPRSTTDAGGAPRLSRGGRACLVFGARHGTVGAAALVIGGGLAGASSLGALGLVEVDCPDGGDLQALALGFGQSYAGRERVGFPSARLGGHRGEELGALGPLHPGRGAREPCGDPVARVAWPVGEVVRHQAGIVAACVVVWKLSAISRDEQPLKFGAADGDDVETGRALTLAPAVAEPLNVDRDAGFHGWSVIAWGGSEAMSPTF
jgi:hypothetical protein